LIDTTMGADRVRMDSRRRRRAWWRCGQIAGRAVRSFANLAMAGTELGRAERWEVHASAAFRAECAARRYDYVELMQSDCWIQFRNGYYYGWEQADA